MSMQQFDASKRDLVPSKEMDDTVSQSTDNCSAPTLCIVRFYLLLPCGASIFRESGMPSEGRSLRLSPKKLPVC